MLHSSCAGTRNPGLIEESFALQVKFTNDASSLLSTKELSQRRIVKGVSQRLMTAMEVQSDRHACQSIWRCWTYTFKPEDKIRVGWDVAMLVLVIYSCFNLPYKTVRIHL